MFADMRVFIKCFNEHLPEHNKYCGTKSIQCQPKGQGIEIEFKKNSSKQMVVDDETPKQTKPKKKSSKKKPAPVEIESEVAPVVVEEEEELELDDLIADLKVTTDPEPKPVVPAMSQSFSHFGRGKPRTIAEREAFTKEHINLRHTEFAKHEYSWMTPEWINAQLRKTERGRKLLEQGDLSGPVTDVKSLIEQGYISWEKPEWTRPKLRKTARGEAIKREAIQHENSFKEERAHHSFSH